MPCENTIYWNLIRDVLSQFQFCILRSFLARYPHDYHFFDEILA